MASYVLDNVDVFPNGTSVGAFLGRDIPEGHSGPPGASAVNSQTMTAGTLTFTGLTEGENYVAGASVNGTWRYLRFAVDAPPHTGVFTDDDVTFTGAVVFEDEPTIPGFVHKTTADTITADHTLTPTGGEGSVTAKDLAVVRQRGMVSPLFPEFGAAGDGTTDDTDAIVEAVATGRDVDLGGPDSTYLISSGINLTAGQRVYGRGATIKRANQVHTTTTTAITSGVTTAIDVASATGLRVGQRLVLEKAGTYDTQSRRIQSIVGTTVTVSTAFGIASASGTVQVYTAHFGIQGTDDNHIYGVEIDGNKTNWTFAKWENTVEIEVQGHRSVIRDCYIHDAPGEAIVAFGDFTSIRYTICEDINGNGVHFGEGQHIICDGVRVRNANLTDPDVGHSDGGIIWSDNINDVTIVNCYVENAKCGIGSVDSVGNSNVTIANNTIRDCTETAIEGTFPEDDAASNLVITGNRIYDSMIVAFNQVSAASTEFPEGLIFTDNLLVNTRLGLTRVYDFTVRGNIIRDSGDTSSLEAPISDCKRGIVEGNHITGGNTAVEVAGSATEHIAIRGNHFINQNAFGINQVDADLIGVCFDNNHVVNDATAAATYEGIRVRGKARAAGNFIVLNKGTYGILAIDNSIVKNNIVRHGTATYSIFCFGGSTGIIFKDNETTQAITDNGDALNTTGNVVVP